MPSAEEEALAAAEAAPREPDGALDHTVFRTTYKRALDERNERLMYDARATFRALEGWPTVKGEEDWQATVRKAAEDLDNGGFLIDRLGAERYLDPHLMATLLVIRRRLIDEYGATTAAQLMIIDNAVLIPSLPGHAA